ncbi:hypothetical protein PCL_01012 [Purpureocillium lilacinum]|uniref:PTM1-like N-terminal domain-containing protein n=1 Tax=Purpureocillium lilacinum TaxID=33203 RepID=A0A2U3E4B5_PURLI|nr:hypothetical protein PCL_01012 [Purpureocillium lilacinum]
MHLNSALLLLVQSLRVVAFTRSLPLDHTWANHQQCIDINSPATFQPLSQSSLFVNFATGGEGIVSVVVFELGDEHLGGIRAPGSNEKEVLCTTKNSQSGLCSESQLGEFLISDKARRHARHPFITRAVNLSSPVSLHYPVTGPGFYCVAAVGFTAKTFSATMTAIDPVSGSLPAFRGGELLLYQYLGPAWIVLAAAWMLRAFETSTSLCWLVPVSAVQVALRWSSLEMGVRGGAAAVAVRILWFAAEAVECSGVLMHTHRIATAGHPGDSKSWFVRTSLVLFIAMFTATSAADFVATAVSRAPAYANVPMGVFLGSYIAICIVRSLRRQTPVYGSKQARASSGLQVKVFAGLLGLICLFCAVVAVGNAWIAMQPIEALEFGHRFWRVRFWAIQTPFELVFLFWTACTVVYCRYQDSAETERVLDVEELRKLGSSTDSDGADY